MTRVHVEAFSLAPVRALCRAVELPPLADLVGGEDATMDLRALLCAVAAQSPPGGVTLSRAQARCLVEEASRVLLPAFDALEARGRDDVDVGELLRTLGAARRFADGV